MKLIDKFPRYQQGLSLVELMIAMLLGVFLTGGAIQVVLSSKQSFSLNEELSWMQENSRFAAEFIARDLRMAGYFGCGSQSLSNTLKPVTSGSNAWQFNFDEGLVGYDGDDSNYPTAAFPVADRPTLASGALPKSDALTILRGATDDESYSVVGHNVTSAVIDLDPNPSFTKGRILMVSDCDHAAIFQNTGNNPSKAGHNTGGSVVPGNCTKGLGYPVVCTTNGNSYKYGGDAFVMEVLAHAYYVKQAVNLVPAIYRQEVTGGVAASAEELVQGIESMQVLFGEDTDAISDGVPNRYVIATNVTSWNKVSSVRIHLLARSLTPIASSSQTFRFVGNSYTPTDKYLRKEFITTVQIRNRRS